MEDKGGKGAGNVRSGGICTLEGLSWLRGHQEEAGGEVCPKLTLYDSDKDGALRQSAKMGSK